MAGKAIPEFNEPPEAIKEHIRQWYETHKHTYHLIWDRLAQIRERWDAVDREGKIALLKLSYINSVLSIRTVVHIHEETFARIMSGEDMWTAFEKGGAGLAGNRIPAMHETLADDALWDEVVDLLVDDKVDAAHKLLMDEAQWLGTAKAPFTLANLGFTQKMCINGNVSRLMAAESQPSTARVDAYEGLCADIQAMFPELSERLAPYELQWVLFDYQRFYRANSEGGPERTADGGMAVAQHNIWFETALGDMERVKNRMKELSSKGETVPQEVHDDPQDDDEIGEADESKLRLAIEDAINSEADAESVRQEVDEAIEQAMD